MLAALAFVLWLTPAAFADYEQAGNFATEPLSEGQKIAGVSGAAVNFSGVGGVEPGSLYVTSGDLESTVLRYSPTGKLREIWGWDTIASGPDLPDQISSLQVSATSGTYELTVETAKGQVRYTQGSRILTGVRGEVGAFHVGDAVEQFAKLFVAEGSGDLSAGSKTIASVTGNFEQFQEGMEIFGPGIPAGTTVVAASAGAGTVTMSKAATETRAGTTFKARVTIAAVGSGTLELSTPAEGSSFFSGGSMFLESPITATETTAPIPFDASAVEVEAALLALPAFEAGDVSVSGGPGDADGTIPYEVSFEGAYAGSPVRLSSMESTLAGGVPSPAVTISTPVAASTPSFQRCRLYLGDRCTAESPYGEEQGAGAFRAPTGIAVDQATGYVYVLNYENKHDLIEVFGADGSEVIARFGDAAANVSVPTTEEPEKIHARGGQSIAVDESGTVYVGDGGYPERVMCFRPKSAGDYQHYEYCGSSHDITGVTVPEHLALDEAGHLYVAKESLLEERSSAEAGSPLLCSVVPVGRIFAMTVNPHTGEVFYFDGSPTGKKVHRLKPCDSKVGKFEEAQAPIVVSPPTKQIYALVLNPDLSWGAGRPAGVLYGASRTGQEVEGVPYYGLGYVFAPANTHPPEVISESASSVHTGSAVLHAQIDPYGHATHYAFQYESEAQYEANEPGERFVGANEAPAGGAQMSSGASGQVAVTLTGLSPDTAYRFRVVASSICDATHPTEPCFSDGDALSFATYPLFPPGLPDHRVYELVSPAQKNGGEVIPDQPQIGSCPLDCKPSGLATYPVQSARDGEALAYMGQPFSPFEGTSAVDAYVSRRGASGWATAGLLPALPPGVRLLAFDGSLAHGLLGTCGSSVTCSALEVQDTAAPGSTTSLVSATNDRAAGELSLSYDGHSADFSRVFFSANDSLTRETVSAPEPSDPGVSGKDLYEWHDGQLALVNVLPGNATVAGLPSFASVSPDAYGVSNDGSRVFWQAGGKLYVRVDGSHTLEVAAGEFLAASPEGTRVLLKSGKLFALNGAGTAYEESVDLTEGQNGFLGVAGTSEDLSKIYFVDGAALATAPEAGSCSSGSGQPEKEELEGKVPPGHGCNLYSYEAGASVRFIATLSAGDGATAGHALQDWNASPAGRTAEASPDGRFLAFGSIIRLTGYYNRGPCGRETSKVGETLIIESVCPEAFLYDSVTDRVVCASCDPTGQAPLGPTTLRMSGGAQPALPQVRYLTDEGRLYFDSGDSLSARDTNEGVEDVYEHEPQGAGKEGSCPREEGCVFLISAGTGSVDSNLVAVDQTGKNVFFDTRAQLSLRDKDELLDVYDAREGGGLGGETEVANAECQGEACQSAPQPPLFSNPGSTTFSGAGNLVSSPAASKSKSKATGKRTSGGKLATELRACRHKRAKRKRAVCERNARKRAGKASARGATRSRNARVGGRREGK